MDDDTSLDSFSTMELGRGSTTSAEVIDTKQEVSVRLVHSPGNATKRLNVDNIEFNDEEEYKRLDPERKAQVGGLHNARPGQSNRQVTSSKIDWGQDVILSPSKTNMTAAQLTEIILKQKAEELEDEKEWEARLRQPRPLTGSMAGRLDTPDINFERMTDSPSPEKSMKRNVNESLDDLGAAEAVHIEDQALEVFEIVGESSKQSEQENAEPDNDIKIGNEIFIENADMRDDLSIGSQKTQGSDNDPRSRSPGGGVVSPEIGIISDDGLIVDTRPIVKYRGKSGHFTEGILQQFPMWSEDQMGDLAQGGGGSSSLLASTQSALENESFSTSSATMYDRVPNIIKPIQGSSLMTSVKNGGRGSVNEILERFAVIEKKNREKELMLSMKEGRADRSNLLSLEASAMTSGSVSESIDNSVNTGGSRSHQNNSYKDGSIQSGDNAGGSSSDSAHSSSIEIDCRLPALPVSATAASRGASISGDIGQLSDGSSLHSGSINSTSQTTNEDPLRRITLQPQTSINQLYDASQREALALFYLNDQGSNDSLNDDDSLSSVGAAEGLIPYRIHNRIMGWKLTTPKKRRQLLGMLDSVHELNNIKPGSHASSKVRMAPPISRQAQAWGDAVKRMHRARDRTPEGYFKKLMKERAEISGFAQRGSSRPGSVQTRLITETDKAGLHRAIRDGLTTMENEVFLEAVREKSRERSRQMSRQKSNDAGAKNSSEGVGIVKTAEEKQTRNRTKNRNVSSEREGLGSRGRVEGVVTSWND